MNPEHKKMEAKIVLLFFIVTSLACPASAQSDNNGTGQTLNAPAISRHGELQDIKSKNTSQSDVITKSTTPFNNSEITKAKEKMIEEIKTIVEDEEEVLEYVPELRRKKDKDGKELYVYADGKLEMKLEGLDENRLRELFKKVADSASKIKTVFLKQEIDTAIEAQKRPPRPPRLPVRPPPQPPRR